MAEIPLAALDRIIRKSSGLRVSETASKELGLFLESEGEKIARTAAEYARHAGRKTIVDADIKLAVKK
ncbi:MAG: histone [Candidatus Diapherotrites archaeon CG10_big_fil_rev_8_21_14_0_10_31_34]|nr:MAG: histone [Candidatus Diapherotrites archaeon CG10_big_fil_rev_8_21_14_0_10_31_34]PJA17623.1 MAG: histone [Candidatus Diapherotrites archaeon CG_4_10_14_0_2_um_filter_31_5]